MFKRTCATLALAAVAPWLMAAGDLRNSTPSFFQPGAASPAPEAFSLPPAEALTTPTIIMVSPTVLVASPSLPVSASLSLPLPVSATTPTAPVVQQVIIIQQPAPNAMPPLSIALCAKGMELVQNIAMLSYQQETNQSTLTLGIAASGVAQEAASGQWPNFAGFNKAVGKLPWFYPQKTELNEAITAAKRLCQK